MFFKFIFFAILIGWLIRSVLRFLVAGLTGQQRTAGARQQQYSTPKNDGRVKVDYAPKDVKGKNSDNFKGGEYIDYEEVK